MLERDSSRSINICSAGTHKIERTEEPIDYTSMKIASPFFHGWISRYFHFQRFAPGTCHDAQRSRNFRMYNHGERAVLGSSASPPNFFDYTRSCFCFLSVRRARFFSHPLYLAYVHVSMITCIESMRFKKKCSHPFRNLQAYTFGPSR